MSATFPESDEACDAAKEQSAGPGFDRNHYVVERLFAKADDGVLVPVTVLRRRDTALDGRAPLMMYGCGAYGYFVPPDFSAPNLSLVDRGWIYAIAHVRGGSAKGRSWLLAARRPYKKISFTDFVSCATALIDRRYTRAGNIVIYKFSAGGRSRQQATFSRISAAQAGLRENASPSAFIRSTSATSAGSR